jgi:hypothetical protein
MEIVVEKTGRYRGSKFTVSRVAFGLGTYEPLLEFRESKGLMDIRWGEVPRDDEAQMALQSALSTSGIHEWVRSLFYENWGRLPRTSELEGPCCGRWIACPADIGHKVVDVMSTFLEEAMEQIIPTLGLPNLPSSARLDAGCTLSSTRSTHAATRATVDGGTRRR